MPMSDRKSRHPLPAVYCEACGDCVYCFAEDECLRSSDGKHQSPEEAQGGKDGSPDQEGVAQVDSAQDRERPQEEGMSDARQ